MSEVHVHRFSNALVNKGFARVESKHHTMFWLVVHGTRTSIRTRISHGQRKVDDTLLSEIARELHLPKRDLLRFIQCEITAEGYADLMIGCGHVRL
jgi:acyl-CoA hydrolase